MAAAVSSNVSVRDVRDEDTDALVALWNIVFPEYNDPNYPQRDPRANIARKLAMRDHLFWIATNAANELVGSVMAGYDGHRGWLYSLGVHPNARRGGIARALLSHAEAALRARGCVKLNLQVMADNEGAMRFYGANGFGQDRVVSWGKRL
jgi:ribosomal protein S18 acetylase RimI-like enzyme